jgi:putative membrane protein
MFLIILAVVLSIFVAIVAIQNSGPVMISFLAWEFGTNLILIILASFLAGMLIAFCWGLKVKATHYLKDRKTNEMLKELEADKKLLEEKLQALEPQQKEIKEAATKVEADLAKAQAAIKDEAKADGQK